MTLRDQLTGPGIGDPRLLSDSQFDSSLKITSALVAQIVQQDSLFSMVLWRPNVWVSLR